MDTSVSRALIIVAGVLLAMLVIAFMTYSFNKMGGWVTTEEDEVLIAQKEKFNKEYEVFDKPLMYGVDVISCLNKAYSNNKKIYSTFSEKKDEIYHINVSLEIKSDLKESMLVYKSNGKTKDQLATADWDSKCKIADAGFKKIPDSSEFSGNSVSLQTADVTSDMKKGIYNLTYNWTNETNEKILRDYLNNADALNEIVKNTFKEKISDSDGYFWTKAEYRSAIYDLKTRKFKCTGITYNPKTGLIDTISFEELR